MLRKRSRPLQDGHSRGQQMADLASESPFSSPDHAVHKARSSSSFFTLPGLFVGFTTKSSDTDSSRSPTSPLDHKLISTLSNNGSFARSPKSWDSNRVGLGLVDSLTDDSKPCGNVLGSPDSRKILFGSQMRINIAKPKKTHLDSIRNDPAAGDAAPKSLPNNYGIPSQSHLNSPELAKETIATKDSKLASSPLPENFSGSFLIAIGLTRGLIGSLSASEIELSEDYTCIISHGPNPKTTHIFGNCILENHPFQSFDSKNKTGEEAKGSSWVLNHSDDPPIVASDDFLGCCFTCKKKLEQGKDIYMYSGEKAFCSCNCCDEEILLDEEMEKPATDPFTDCLGTSFHEEIFLSGITQDN